MKARFVSLGREHAFVVGAIIFVMIAPIHIAAFDFPAKGNLEAEFSPVPGRVAKDIVIFTPSPDVESNLSAENFVGIHQMQPESPGGGHCLRPERRWNTPAVAKVGEIEIVRHPISIERAAVDVGQQMLCAGVPAVFPQNQYDQLMDEPIPTLAGFASYSVHNNRSALRRGRSSILSGHKVALVTIRRNLEVANANQKPTKNRNENVRDFQIKEDSPPPLIATLLLLYGVAAPIGGLEIALRSRSALGQRGGLWIGCSAPLLVLIIWQMCRII